MFGFRGLERTADFAYGDVAMPNCKRRAISSFFVPVVDLSASLFKPFNCNRVNEFSNCVFFSSDGNVIKGSLCLIIFCFLCVSTSCCLISSAVLSITCLTFSSFLLIPPCSFQSDSTRRNGLGNCYAVTDLLLPVI